MLHLLSPESYSSPSIHPSTHPLYFFCSCFPFDFLQHQPMVEGGRWSWPCITPYRHNPPLTPQQTSPEQVGVRDAPARMDFSKTDLEGAMKVFLAGIASWLKLTSGSSLEQAIKYHPSERRGNSCAGISSQHTCYYKRLQLKREEEGRRGEGKKRDS